MMSPVIRERDRSFNRSGTAQRNGISETGNQDRSRGACEPAGSALDRQQFHQQVDVGLVRERSTDSDGGADELVAIGGLDRERSDARVSDQINRHVHVERIVAQMLGLTLSRDFSGHDREVDFDLLGCCERSRDGDISRRGLGSPGDGQRERGDGE
jgi:hypothetical protein